MYKLSYVRDVMIRRDLYECRMVAWCEALKGSVLYGMVKCIL